MVYIKSVELSHFKSFGGTTNVPLLPGFTVVSGPNGSGKSNILDALLFCLGLASSKGMRAERLPDLVNHNHPTKGTSEAIVTVTFALENESLLSDSEQENQPVKDWSVTRKLRVTASGSYTSNYYINGSPATLTELHEKLNKLRVYPEGYNVVLQGDVTSIISMNPKERREIIDELAGVATFDRKIIQTKETLASVKEKEDSCRIIETELINQLERLSQDKIKAEKYQKLRTELQEKELFAVVFKWRSLLQQQSLLTQQITTGEQTQIQLSQNLLTLNQEIDQLTQELDQLNILVKSLGEDELISFQSILATQQVNLRQLQKQKQDLESSTEEREIKINATQTELSQNKEVLVQLSEELSRIETELTKKNQQKSILQQTLKEHRQQGENIASASDVWVQQQTSLTHNIENLLQIIEPKRTEQTQLRERYHQLGKQINQQNQILNDVYELLSTKNANLAEVENNYLNSLSPIQNLENSLTSAERELQIQKETETRLLSEQREKQRQLDKLETQLQVQQESSGTYALQIITQSGLTGICGLVAQLGKVEPRYQLALEICAGGRLGNLVVEDDGVAAAAIQLLKQRKAGRMTFLPLNKIQAPRYNQTTALRYAQGYIDYAVNLIECEQRYRNIFAYVFGGTVIFDKLESARAYLGQYRIVTLDGELLESSGAMTGGSMSNNRSGLHFGTVDLHDSTEINNLKQRLHEIDVILARCLQIITQKTSEIKIKGQELNERKQQRRELQLQVEQLQREIKSLEGQREQLKSVLNQSTIELGNVQESLRELDQELPGQESELQRLRQALSELEKSQTNAQWQQINSMIKQLESQLSEQDQLLRQLEQNEQKLINQQQRLQEKNLSLEEIINQLSTDDVYCQDEIDQIAGEIFNLQGEINETQRQIGEVEKRLGESKERRDRAEKKLRSRTHKQQEVQWEIEKLTTLQNERREQLLQLEEQIEQQRTELPDPLPEIPALINDEEEGEKIAFDNYEEQLENLQKQIKSLQKKLQALEPVNMLALEEYQRTQVRLDDLSGKLQTLEAERTELLLRIENFTTLRYQAFKEAFDAVNQNFQVIFAELSEGDGFLQLENELDPFAGGLNLVAHPKGKPVQRLTSMSGGEKSLTALSFIFALQRYRPSPFYAFDEVDMFLDGANVEKLAKMIKKQSMEAQFIVVSLRRPMIASAQRTIGVTQARGAYTQVLGMKIE